MAIRGRAEKIELFGDPVGPGLLPCRRNFAVAYPTCAANAPGLYEDPAVKGYFGGA